MINIAHIISSDWQEQKEENRDYGGSRAVLGPGGYTLAVNVKDRPPSLGMLRETSIERQIWQLVDASGDQGLTQKVQLYVSSLAGRILIAKPHPAGNSIQSLF